MLASWWKQRLETKKAQTEENLLPGSPQIPLRKRSSSDSPTVHKRAVSQPLNPFKTTQDIKQNNENNSTEAFSEELQKPIFLHFLGSTALSCSFVAMILRLFVDINEIVRSKKGKALDIPTKAAELEAVIPDFLDAASLHVRISILCALVESHRQYVFREE